MWGGRGHVVDFLATEITFLLTLMLAPGHMLSEGDRQSGHLHCGLLVTIAGEACFEFCSGIHA